MTHDQLCGRALRWLSGTMRCDPVFSNIASCDEIPDAIGWTSAYKFRGSIVVECKTSISDFLADKKKTQGLTHPQFGYTVSARRWRGQPPSDYLPVTLPRMGKRRYFMCEGGHVVSVASIAKHAPDHGLLYVEGNRVRVVVPAPERTAVDMESEIRYLRFAIINHKTPHGYVAARPFVAVN